MISDKKHFSVRDRIQSFKHAFTGIFTMIVEESNARIHIVSSILVILAGFIFRINRFEWIAILFSIGIVMAIEALNTSLENLSNAVSKDFNPNIKKCKDIAAGAVLIVSIVAALIGLIVFIPYLLKLF
jgi:diacylglycerol kinase (ATP)